MPIRELTDHIVAEDQNPQLKIEALDGPGPGGAGHEYRVSHLLGFPPAPIGTDIGLGRILSNTRIQFQNGPIQETGQNGLTNEALLAILIDRLRGFQSGPFACRENAIALTKIEEALMWLQKRTRSRAARGVEGTMKI